MVSGVLPTFLLLWSYLSCTQAQGHPAFNGLGHIIVLNSSDITTANPKNRIGCMDETGALTLSDCAVFTKGSSGLTSSLGNCTFHDNSQPYNADSAYGQVSTAWHCGAESIQDLYYSFNLALPLICHGDLDCYYDVKVAPKPEQKLPLWEFVWGSQQMGITPGHTQAVWLWEPVASNQTTGMKNSRRRWQKERQRR